MIEFMMSANSISAAVYNFLFLMRHSSAILEATGRTQSKSKEIFSLFIPSECVTKLWQSDFRYILSEVKAFEKINRPTFYNFRVYLIINVNVILHKNNQTSVCLSNDKPT